MCLWTVSAKFGPTENQKIEFGQNTQKFAFSKHEHIRNIQYPCESGVVCGLFVFHKYCLIIIQSTELSFPPTNQMLLIILIVSVNIKLLWTFISSPSRICSDSLIMDKSFISYFHCLFSVLVHLSRWETEVSMFAPDINQMHVIKHAKGEPSEETR